MSTEPTQENLSTVALVDQLSVVQKAAADAESLLVSLRVGISELEGLKARADDAHHRINSKLEEAQVAASAAIAAQTKVADAQAVVATKSDHIQAAQEHADKVRADLDRAQTAATQHVTEVEGFKNRTQSAADSATNLLAEIRELRLKAVAEAEAVGDLLGVARTSTDTTRGLADRAENIEARLSGYETELTALHAQSEQQLKTITELLPGATAAGLAHAFDDRRKAFLSPARKWQVVFVAALSLIVTLAGLGLVNDYLERRVLSWDELARIWAARLPIAASLVWLALYSSRESALAKRLEEDYGYKAAVAASFIGFQNQMTQVGKTASEGSPLAQLCKDTLETIGSPPGRIYDKHQLTTTPMSELTAAVKTAVEDRMRRKGAE